MKRILIIIFLLSVNTLFFINLKSIDGIINFNDHANFSNFEILKNYLTNVFQVYNLHPNLGALKSNFLNEYIPYGFTYVLSSFF